MDDECNMVRLLVRVTFVNNLVIRCQGIAKFLRRGESVHLLLGQTTALCPTLLGYSTHIALVIIRKVRKEIVCSGRLSNRFNPLALLSGSGLGFPRRARFITPRILVKRILLRWSEGID